MQSLYSRARLIVSAAALALAVATTAIAANPDDVQRLKSTGNCPGCDLSEAHLTPLDLQKANLAGANLSKANLYAADLRGADLTGAILDEADLNRADLTGAINAVLANATTNEFTTCPDGNAGPCR